MPLIQCKLCGKLFDSSYALRDICHDCRMKLEGTYNRVHKYLKTHEQKGKINAEWIAYELEEDIETIKFLIDNGWLERDMQTYSNIISKRRELAGEFEQELGRMKTERHVNTYGGKIYSRRK